jgi:Zn finger protein HypA/HybF involved in hydrogenase expression
MARKKAHGTLTNKDVALLVERAKSATPCMDCGQRYPSYVMDFDHARGVKVAGVSQMVKYGYTIEQIQSEIEKCDIVCSNCHRERTHRRVQQRKLTS